MFLSARFDNIKITDVILSNTKRRLNIVLLLGLRRRQWYNIKPTESQINMFTGPSECVSISQTNLYIYGRFPRKWTLF